MGGFVLAVFLRAVSPAQQPNACSRAYLINPKSTTDYPDFDGFQGWNHVVINH
jgi:hypothetical protein